MNSENKQKKELFPQVDFFDLSFVDFLFLFNSCFFHWSCDGGYACQATVI